MADNPKNKFTWIDLSTLQIGASICLPAMMMGQKLGQSIGLLDAIIVIFMGNFSISFLGFLFAKMAYKSKEDTLTNAAKYLGSSGTKLFAYLLFIQYLVWNTVQLNMLYKGMDYFLPKTGLFNAFTGILPALDPTVWHLILGTAVSLISFISLKSLNIFKWFFRIILPFLAGTLIYSIYTLVGKTDGETLSLINEIPSLSFWEAISIVIGAKIVGALNIPNFYRFAKGQQHGNLAIFCTYLIGIPLVEIFGAYMGSTQGGNDILPILGSLGGVSWQIWLMGFFLLVGITTNLNNTYHPVHFAKAILPKSNMYVNAALISIGCVLFSQTINLDNNFTLFLKLIGIFSCSMGAVIFVNYMFHTLKWGKHFPNTYNIFWNEFSWLAGCAYGVTCLFFPIKLFGVECLDTFIFTSLFVVLGKWPLTLLLQNEVKVEEDPSFVVLTSAKRAVPSKMDPIQKRTGTGR